MLIKHVILATLVVPSIMAALSSKDITKALIGAKENLVKIFKQFEKEQGEYELPLALADVASIQEHIPKVVTCLRTVDPFPKEVSNVSWLVHSTLACISNSTLNNPESFAKVIASFEPSDVKPLASIHHITLLRSDTVDVLESVMDKSPELITGSLSRWLANHIFDRNSSLYALFEVTRIQAFQYLTSFATEHTLEDALSIVKANEHYKVDSRVCCCNPHGSFPQHLYNKLSALLVLVKARSARINEILAFLPKVLVDMVIDYLRASTN